jgi:hypothetical protein
MITKLFVFQWCGIPFQVIFSAYLHSESICFYKVMSMSLFQNIKN